MSLRLTELPNGLFLIRDMASGLEAVANADGSWRHGVFAVWLAWTR